MGADDVTTIVDERYEPRHGEIIPVKVLDVPASEKYPEGIKYAFHYGRTDDDTTYLIRQRARRPRTTRGWGYRGTR